MADAASAGVVRQPRGPVLGWRSAWPAPPVPATPHVMQLPYRRFTTSGRAALWHALRLLALPSGAGVLVPTYHCPTLVAPVVSLGLTPRFYGVDAEGAVMLGQLASAVAEGARVLVVPHFFGRARSLAAERQWCDAHRVALVEDCAHSLMGMAGERQVGAWGDLAIASLTKFLPVPEAGLLGSAMRPLPAMELVAPGLRQQAKALVDLIERRPARGLGGLLIGTLQRARRAVASAPSADGEVHRAREIADLQRDMMEACDMARVAQRPTLAAAVLTRALPLGDAARRRRAHFDHFAAALADLPGTRALWPQRGDDSVPYVFPLWVDDADRVYAQARREGLAVLRWDRVWPGTPAIPGDQGALWSRHVLQLLCHQDLAGADIVRTTAAIRRHVGAAAP